MLGKEETVSPIERGLFIRPSQHQTRNGVQASVCQICNFLKRIYEMLIFICNFPFSMCCQLT